MTSANVVIKIWTLVAHCVITRNSWRTHKTLSGYFRYLPRILLDKVIAWCRQSVPRPAESWWDRITVRILPSHDSCLQIAPDVAAGVTDGHTSLTWGTKRSQFSTCPHKHATLMCFHCGMNSQSHSDHSTSHLTCNWREDVHAWNQNDLRNWNLILIHEFTSGCAIPEGQTGIRASQRVQTNSGWRRDGCRAEELRIDLQQPPTDRGREAALRNRSMSTNSPLCPPRAQ